ncbi:hypothetical protein QR685DRAFT_572285 [Neurospora intermedia]|uniref:Uncharacterized protein n=1 Tax=Neurospora intermedia TaxID=5142 RepID=A0ABR3D997_NEUIN
MAASSVLEWNWNTVGRASQWFIPRWQRIAICCLGGFFVSIPLATQSERYNEQELEGSIRLIPVHYLTGRCRYMAIAGVWEEGCTGHIQPEHEPATSATFRQPCL